MIYAGEVFPRLILIQNQHFLLEYIFSRFIINIPPEQRDDIVRVFFAIELAHWHYVDFYREDNDDLPNYSLKEFAQQSEIIFIDRSIDLFVMNIIF